MDATQQCAKNANLEAAEKELLEAEVKYGTSGLQLLPILDSLAQMYQCNDLENKATELYRRAVEIAKASGETGLDASEYLFKLGSLCRIEGRLDEAESLYSRALAIYETQQGPDAKRTYAEKLCGMSGLFCEKGDWVQAEELLLKAASIFSDTFGENNYYSRLCYLGLAQIYLKQGKRGQADDMVTRSAYKTPSAAKTPEPNARSEERALIELVRLYYEQERFNEVEILVTPAIFSNEEKLWAEHPRVGQALHDRGELFRAQGQHEEAERTFRRALEIRLKSLGNAHVDTAATAFSLAVMMLSLNRYIDAEDLLKLALKVRVRALGVENPSVAACIETYAVLLKKTKRLKVAQRLDARARDIRSELVRHSERRAATASR